MNTCCGSGMTFPRLQRVFFTDQSHAYGVLSVIDGYSIL